MLEEAARQRDESRVRRVTTWYIRWSISFGCAVKRAHANDSFGIEGASCGANIKRSLMRAHDEICGARVKGICVAVATCYASICIQVLV